MSEQKFKEAKSNLAFSQSLVDRFKAQQNPQIQQPDMGMSDTTPQSVEQPLPAANPSPFDSFQLSPQKNSQPAPQPTPAPQFSFRGTPVSDLERQQLKKAIYSEVSGREKPIEVSGMANVAFNQASSSKRSVGDVASDPNFFQGITNKRYSEVPQGEDANIMDFVSNEVDRQLNENAPDHTIGATHFVHITKGGGKDKLVTMTEKEFTKYLSKKDGERDKYAESLLE